MRFGILGPLEVAENADRPLELGGRKQRAVLAILLLHANEVVSSDRLVEDLWSGRPPASAAASLQAHVSRLRRALGSGRRIVTTGGGYRLRVAPGELDRECFEQLVEEGSAAVATGDWELVSARLREALGLWRGPPLSEFQYDSFAQGEIARLEELRVGAVEQRIEAELALGREAQVVGDLERLVREHPYRERLHGQLMLALYRCGRQAEALAAYQAARRALVEELGIDPSAELQRLEQGILRHDPSLSTPGAQKAPPATGHVPVQAASVLGMIGELPTGTVTFVFTDIEGSTALLDQLGEGYGELLFAYYALLRGVWESYGGVEVKIEGDAFFVAFSSASRAVAATAAGQAALAAHGWPHGERMRVRMGVHTGEPRIREGEYWGPDVHYAARVASAARGGEVLVSAAAAALVRGAELTSLGRHRLKDFPEPRELFALGPGPHPAPKTLDPLRTNLPTAPTPLVGRDEEVDEVVSLLLGDARLVSVVGAGGIGKTRLGLAVADRLLDELVDGAFLVELAEVTTSDPVAGAIASVVGTTADLLAATLAGRELLLVLDNFEHILGAAPLLSELLAAAPRLRILVTSQMPLRLAEEQAYPLAGLAAGPAEALLIARAKRASHGFAVDDAGAEAVAALCRELDGSPLGIELAAARLALLSPEELLDRLRRSPDALGTGGRNWPERQRGLRAAMRWSYSLLDPRAASLFRRIGHFVAQATLERIEQVCGEGIDDILESVAELVDTSLVRRTRDGRFEVASALRTYSRELLEESGERDILCRRHAEVVVAEWLPLSIDQPMIAFRETYGPIVAEQSDLAVLLDWSARSDAELFSQLIACTYSPLSVSLGVEQMRRWRAPLEEAAATGPATGRVRANVCTAAAVACEARTLDVAEKSDTEGDPIFAGWLYASCVVMDALHVPGPAWQARAQAVAAELRSSPDADVRDLAAIVDAHLLLLQNRFDAAADAFEAAIRRGGGTWVAETPVYMVGDCHLYAGRSQAALAAYARGVVAARDESMRDNIAFQGEGIVAALADLGRHEEALRTLGACDTLTGEGVLPREHNAFWGGLMAARIASARAALGAKDADAAYARGRALGVEEVVELLLSFGPPVAVASSIGP